MARYLPRKKAQQCRLVSMLEFEPKCGSSRERLSFDRLKCNRSLVKHESDTQLDGYFDTRIHMGNGAECCWRDEDEHQADDT